MIGIQNPVPLTLFNTTPSPKLTILLIVLNLKILAIE